MTELKKMKFVYDHMNFSVTSTSAGSHIVIEGKKPRIIIYNVPPEISPHLASVCIRSYFDGMEEGRRKIMSAAADTTYDRMKQQYYADNMEGA